MITSGNRAKETTATSGTGTYLLDGPLAGFQSLASAAGKTSGAGGPWEVRYCVSDDVDFEIGVGTVTAGGPDTLTRDTIEDSSTGGAAINWGANTKNVFLAFSAAQLAQLTDNDSGNGLLRRTAADEYGVVALPLPIASGGTGSATAAAARTALGVDDATLEGTFVKHGNESSNDEKVREILSGDIADLPANDAVSPGRLYLTTDADAPTTLLWDSGTEWVELGVGAGVNPVVNGACQVAQQVANDLATVADVYSQVDGFIAYTQGFGITAGVAKQAANSNGLGNSEFVLKFEGVSGTGGGSIVAKHRIESRNIRHLAGKKVSVGIVVRHDVGSDVSYDIRLATADAQDDFSSVTNKHTSSTVVIPTGTNTKLVFEEVDLDTSAVRGLEIQVWANPSGALTTKNFEYAELQLHHGPIVPAFNGSDYAAEKLRCQRYYFSSFADGVEPQQNIGSVVGAHEAHIDSNGYAGLSLRFPVEMISSPTITTFSPDDASADWSVPGSAAHRSATVGSSSNEAGMAIYFGTTTAGDAEEPGYIHYTADARL